MKRVILTLSGAFLLSAVAALTGGCFSDYPIDEDGLLISYHTRTAVLNLNLNDANRQTVVISIPNDELDPRKSNPYIDTVDHNVIRVIVKWKSDITNLWPVFTLATNCKLDPKITDYTDFTDPREYTVISGDRKHSKKYTVYVIRQDPDDPYNYNPQVENPWYEYFEGLYDELP